MGLLKRVARSITRPVAQVVHHVTHPVRTVQAVTTRPAAKLFHHVTHPAKTIKAVARPALKLVDHLGGGYLTGSKQARQKRLYNDTLSEHNNYLSQAQNNINDFGSRLNEAMGQLASLDRQRQQHAQQSVQLQGHTEQYQREMQGLEQHRMNLGSEANALFELFENFKSKAPSLASKISEVQKLPINYDGMLKTVLERRDSLRGLNEEEAGGEIKRYRADVENLKKSRQEMEASIRRSMDEIVRSHAELGSERNTLESRLNSYGHAQNRLLQESDRLDGARSNSEAVIKNYQSEGTRLENEYNSSRIRAESLNNELTNYTNNAQSRLESLANAAASRAGKLQKASFNTEIFRGLALAGLTFGLGSYLAPAAGSSGAAASGAATAGGTATTGAAAAGSASSFWASLLSSLGSGLKFVAPMAGVAAYMGSMNQMRGLGSLKQVDLREDRENYGNDLAAFRNSGTSFDKIGLPELGNLKQSISHFGMLNVPSLQELPKLGESIGKIVAPSGLEINGLGLPQMTSADGRKYSSGVLYDMDMDFIRKLKKTSKWLGTPYLRNMNNSIIPSNSLRGNTAYT